MLTLFYVMLCEVILFYAELRYARLSYVLPPLVLPQPPSCYDMLCYVRLCYAVLSYAANQNADVNADDNVNANVNVDADAYALYHFNKKNIVDLADMFGLNVIKIKPLIFDAFYISMLSEKKKKGSALKGFFVGLWSNIKAKKTTNHSSLIYILQKF